MESARSTSNSSKESFFKDSFENYFSKVAAFAYSYCKDREAAKNIAQDVFISFWENIDSLDYDKTPLPYLFVLAKNKTLNMLNRDMVRGKYNNYLQKREAELRYRAAESSTMDVIYAKDVERIISESMSQMKPNVQKTFYLSRFGHLKNEEIAKALNISIKTVEYRMAGALRIVRAHFQELLGLLFVLIFGGQNG